MKPAATQHFHLPPADDEFPQELKSDGSLVDDFAFVEGEHSLHVLNAPVPAATGSLSIGTEVARRALALAPARRRQSLFIRHPTSQGFRIKP